MFSKEMNIWSTAFITISVMLIESSFALKCWDCSSYDNDHCADPFDSRTIPMADCSNIDYFDEQLCHKSIQKAANGVVIIRGCMIDDSQMEESIEANIDLCNTDGCNSADNPVPLLPMIITAPVLVGLCNILFSTSTRK